MARVALFLTLAAMQASVAVAEVCDKVDECWNMGDLPISIHPFGGWPKFASPYFLLFFLPSIVVAILVWRRRCHERAALWLAGFWSLVAIATLAFGLVENPSDTVLQAAIREGCVGLSWTGGTELPIGCSLTALLLFFCWDRRKAQIPLRTET